MTKILLSGIASIFFVLSSITLSKAEEPDQFGREVRLTHKNSSNLDVTVDNFASQILQQLMQNNKKSIAVADFTDLGGNVTDIGKFMTDEIITRLIISGKLKVVERKYLSEVLRDHRLPLSKALDPTSAKALQNILGVDTIITGTITDLVTRLKVNVRLCNSSTGEIFGAAYMESQTDDNLRNLLEQQTLEPKEINLQNKIEDLSQQITQSMVDYKKKKLVIMEFPDLSGEISNFSKFLYEELISHLMMYKYFDVIEKKLYDNVLPETEGVGNLTSDLSKEIGNVLGADAIAFGTVSNLGTTVHVNIRIITPETGIPFAVSRAEITVDPTVKSLLEVTEKHTVGTETASAGIVLENEPSIKDNVIKPKTRITRLRKSKRVFFAENFNKYSVGEVVPSWGEGIVVVESLGKKGITSKVSGENTITQKANFPEDFDFSFDMKGTSWTWGTLSFFNPQGDRFKMDLRIKDNNFYVNFPNNAEVKMSCNADEYNRISIVKKGKECQIYLNNILVTTYSFENKLRFTNFSFTCRLDTISLTNFAGIEM
ncbi:MAG TPA: FlgO family outer membrane protein [Candidatus Brocadiaceae bacterium]